jgi:ribosomal protein L14
MSSSYCLITKTVKMVFKQSFCYANDGTNVRWIRLFHLYKGFVRKNSKPGFFVKGSARVVEPPRIEMKGFKYKYSIKGDICRMYLIRANYKLFNKSSLQIYFSVNSGFLIKKKQDPKSKFLYGPISRLIKRKKVLSLFKLVI